MSAPIALTCGEPAGVGPELAIKAWQALKGRIPFFYLGDPRHLKALDPDIPLAEIVDPAEALTLARTALPVLQHDFPHPATPGKADLRNAQSVIDVISRAVEMARTGRVGAICTGPINKQVLQEGAGFSFPGHTEFLAMLGDVPHAIMMLSAPGLRVVPVTIHIPLAEVATAFTSDLLETTIRITAKALQDQFGIANPRLAIAGLNPHAGEGGKMGRAEIDMMAPLLKRLSAEGLHLTGPHSADTMFHAEARQSYDAAICAYHDQALIPLKTLDFHGGTNITLGLPFIRTSPDHGTAFDIAGKGLARPDSLIAALETAAEMIKAAK